MLRVIDHKRIDLTDQEWETYNNICKSYDIPPNQQGKDLFVDLFITDENGIIVSLLPPTRQTSFEVMFFLANIFHNQHIRLMHKQVDDVCKKILDKLAQLESVANNKK